MAARPTRKRYYYVSRLRNLGVRSYECCIRKYIVSTNVDKLTQSTNKQSPNLPTASPSLSVSHVAFYRSKKGECQRMALFATGWVTYPMTIPKALANAVADDPTYFLLVVHSPEFLPLPLSLWLLLWDFFCSRKGLSAVLLLRAV